MEKIKEIIKQKIAEILNISIKDIEIDYPPKIEMGDLAVPCFNIAKQLGLPADKIADDLAEKCFSSTEFKNMFSEIKPIGPFLNFRFKDNILLDLAIECSTEKNWSKLSEPDVTMIEFLSPNTNKPLHLGHLRNASLGDALSKILTAVGQKTIKANLINDRGIHICKSMLAWQKWGDGETQESTGKKGDHFVGHFYVLFDKALKEEREQWYLKNNLNRQELTEKEKELADAKFEKTSELLNEARKMLLAWEDGDKDVVSLWHKMNQWVFDGFDVTLKKMGVSFDKVYFESDNYKLGKNIIEVGLEKGIFNRLSDGSVIYNLPVEEFGLTENGQEKFVLVIRPDGTSVYMTQDIATAELKAKEFNLDRSIIVSASEQDYHFKCLFSILRALEYPWAKNCHHLSYGMVNLPSGRMKSREGTVVDADDLIDEMIIKAKEIVLTKHEDLQAEELDKRASIIGLGAMKFYLLIVPAKNNIKYDPLASISLDGMTAPYCQYAAVRAGSILEKAKEVGLILEKEKINIAKIFGDYERELIKKLLQTPERLILSANNYDPSVWAHHVYEVAQVFNKFYMSTQVVDLKTEKEILQARLLLVETTRKVIISGLSLLGIKTPEKM